MPGLTIGWEYLTSYAVATDPSSRERAEWPPHPGRVFMALAAAYFETGEDPAEADALRWLETLGDPEMCLPPREQVAERSNVTVYVPVNDKAGPSAATLQSAPAMTRSKQPRTFPRVFVGEAPCVMHWPEAEGVDEHRSALDRLCGKVTRIGHSSSLVRMWVADSVRQGVSAGERLIPDDQLADRQARTISTGMLKMLVERFGESSRSKHVEINEQIDALKASKKAVKGKGAIDAEIESLEKQLSGIVSRPPIRPSLGLWSGYRRVDSSLDEPKIRHSHFDTDLLVLTKTDGPTLPVVSTLAVTRALRGKILKHVHDKRCGCDRWSKRAPSPKDAASCYSKIPPWVSGHQPDGQPLCGDGDGDGHLACIPLPFVGHEHADGHLLGVALAFPRSVDRRERGRVLGNLLLNKENQPQNVKLTLGRLGVWTVKKRDWSERGAGLQPEAWAGDREGATAWASVTPVVLDRFLKVDRVKNRAAWTDEVTAIIVESCRRIGLPEPVSIDIDTTCWHRGGSRTVGKRRPLRGPHGTDAALGDGFPFYPAKGTNASRPQVHVWLNFAEPIIGPVLLGAGRYLGYGLCKPWEAR